MAAAAPEAAAAPSPRTDAGGPSRDGGRSGRRPRRRPGGPNSAGAGPTAPPPREFQTPGIVVYWGQNGVGSRIVDTTKHEKSLADTCRDNPHYEMIVIGFVIDFFSPENIDRTPRLNFSKHCTSANAYDADHKRLYRCDEIARGVNECQRLNKKVLISLGGAVGGYGFDNDEEARMFAQTTWDLFLGGQSELPSLHHRRPRRRRPRHRERRLRRLQRLRDPPARAHEDRPERPGATTSRPRPSAPSPTPPWAPRPGKALGDVPRLFDFLFVQFYNNFCAAL